jgi:GNAT superfamily N-acetyltransferase
MGASVSRSNVRVGPAESADVAALVALMESTKIARSLLSGRHSPADRTLRLTQRFETILASDRRTVLAAFGEAEDLLGFAVVHEDELAPLDPTPVLQVSDLVIAAGAQRHDIGRSLLAAAVRLADDRDIDHVLVTASSSSRDTNRYFARLGFAPLVIRRIASTTVLRRSLGIGEVPDRLAARRRLRSGRSERPLRVSAAARALRRGA